MDEAIKLAALILVGILSGFLNVTAGGGSLLSLPFLIFLGLPPATANGTNRIAILVQNILATARFRQFKVIPSGLVAVTTIPATIGALLGAQIAVEIDPLLFKRMLAGVMVVMIPFVVFGRSPGAGEAVTPSPQKKLVLIPAFFAIGMYGGFIQGGIGFLLIAALTLTGYDLVRTNALKVLIVLVFTPFALGVFMWNGQVDYLRGCFLAIGNAGGAWIGTHLVVKRGHNFLRWIVLAATMAFAIKLFMA